MAGIVLVLALAGGIFYLGRMSAPKPQPPVATSSPQPSPTSQPTPTDETANWKTYTVQALNLEFKLPLKVTQFGEPKEKIIYPPVGTGFKGTRLCVNLTSVDDLTSVNTCDLRYFLISTISADYNVPRDISFSDSQGFIKVEDNYYARGTYNEDGLGPLISTSSTITKEVKNPNGISILKVTEDFNKEETIPLLDWGAIGALINTKNNSNYPGFAVMMHLGNGLTEEDFDQILSTFRFLD